MTAAAAAAAAAEPSSVQFVNWRRKLEKATGKEEPFKVVKGASN